MAVTEDLLVRLTIDADGVVKAAKVVDESFKNVDKSATKATKSTKKMQTGLEKAELSIIAVNQALQLMSAAFGQAARATGKFVNEFADFETALVGAQKTTNIADKDLQAFGRRMQDLSQTIPVAANELLNIAQNAGQLGVAEQDLEAFTETVAKIGFATDLTSEQAAQAFARILTVTGEGTGGIEEFASTIVALGNNFAATESEITRVATEMANATAQFNLGSTNVLGLSTALKAMGQQAQLAGSVIGKTLREMNSIITQGTGPVFQQLQELTGMTGEQLQKTFKEDATAVFEAFINGLEGIQNSGGNVSAALETFGLKGDEVNKVLPSLAANAGVLRDALAQARGESDLFAAGMGETGALAEETGRAFGTIRTQLVIAENSIDNLVASLGESLAPAIEIVLELFIDMVQGAKEIADGLTNMGIPGTVITVTALGTALAAMIAAGLIPAVLALKSMAGILGITVAGVKAFVAGVGIVGAKILAVVAAVTAFVAGIELLIRNWRELGAFASNVITEIQNLFVGLDEAFRESFAAFPDIVAAYDTILATAKLMVDGHIMLFEILTGAITGVWDWLKSAAEGAFNFVSGLADTWLVGMTFIFETINNTVESVFGISLVDAVKTAFNTILTETVQPVIDQINSLIESMSGFFDTGLKKIEFSFKKVGDEAELTGKRIDGGFTGDAINAVKDKIAAFRGEQKEQAAVTARQTVEFEAMRQSLEGIGPVMTEQEQQMKVLNMTLGETTTKLDETAKATEKLGTTTVKSEAEIKAAQDAAKAAAKERKKAIEDLAKANQQLQIDIATAGATEVEQIELALASRLKELDAIEKMTGQTAELAEARRLANEAAASDTMQLQAAHLAEIVDMNEQLALDAEMFDMDRAERIEHLAELELERLETSLAQLEAEGLANDAIREQIALQKDLIKERRDQETGSRPMDIAADIGMGAMMAFDPASIDQLTGMVDMITDFPSKLLESLGKLDEALMRFLDEFPEAFSKLAQNLGPILTSIIRKLPEVAVTFIQTIVKNMPAIVQGLVTGIKEIAKALPDLIIGIAENLGPLVESLAEAMPEIAVALVMAVVDLFLSGAIFDIAIALVKAIVFQLPMALVKGLVKGLSKSLGKVFGGAGLKFMEPVKDVFGPIMKGFKDLFEKVVKPIFAAAILPYKILFERVVKPLFMAWINLNKMLFERTIKPPLMAFVRLNQVLFEKTIKPVFEGFVKFNKILFEQTVKPLFNAWVTANKAIFEKVVKPVFEGFVQANKVIFEQIVKPVFEGFVQFNRILFEQTVKPVFEGFISAGQAIFQFLQGIVEAFQGVASAFEGIGKSFEGIGETFDGLLSGWEDFFNNLDFEALFDFEAIGKGFQEMFNGLGSIFDFEEIGKKFTEMFDMLNPGNVLEKIFGGDIGGGTGTVEGLLNTDVPIVSFAKGGIVPGLAKTAGDSPINDIVPAMLSPGELVVPRSVADDPMFRAMLSSVIQGQKIFALSLGGKIIETATGGAVKEEDVDGAAKKFGGAVDSFVQDPIGSAAELGQQGLDAVKAGLEQILPGIMAPLELIMGKVKDAMETIFSRAGAGRAGQNMGIADMAEVIDITGLIKQAQEAAIEAARFRFNEGGIVPGAGGRDSVNAMLTPGEFVINRPAVQAVGEPFLRALNTGGTVPVTQNINVTLNIETRGQQLDEAFIKQRVMPAAVEAVKRASIDRKFTMSARGLRTT